MATRSLSSLPRQLARTNPIVPALHTPVKATARAGLRPLSTRTQPSKRPTAHPSAPTRSPIPSTHPTRTSILSHPQTRPYSTPTKDSKTRIYDFPTIRSLSSQPDPNRILIDVREPSEYAPGHIPTSINLPLKSAPEALMLPADEFEDRFGVEKPRVDQEVVFYCMRGVRSSAAARLAEEAGWERVGNYSGSWTEWEKMGGEVERS